MTRTVFILCLFVMTIGWSLYIRKKTQASWFNSIGWGFCAAVAFSVWLPAIFGAK